MVIGQGDVAVQFGGATPNAERKRALIYPDYLELNEEEFQVEVLEIDYPSKFYTLEHRQILGTFMSLGLTRENVVIFAARKSCPNCSCERNCIVY